MAVEDFSPASIESPLDADRRMTAALAESDLTFDVQDKVRSITRSLLPYVSSREASTLGFGEVGGGDSVWLTATVASGLGAMIDSTVHVLVIETARARRGAKRNTALSPSRYSHVEYLSVHDGSYGQQALLLDERLTTLRHTNQRVLLHFEEATTTISLSSVSERLAGLVLIARASRTRRATLESFAMRCGRLGLPLLGAVLLDRTYPIPEQLYRLL